MNVNPVAFGANFKIKFADICGAANAAKLKYAINNIANNPNIDPRFKKLVVKELERSGTGFMAYASPRNTVEFIEGADGNISKVIIKEPYQYDTATITNDLQRNIRKDVNKSTSGGYTNIDESWEYSANNPIIHRMKMFWENGKKLVRDEVDTNPPYYRDLEDWVA